MIPRASFIIRKSLPQRGVRRKKPKMKFPPPRPIHKRLVVLNAKSRLLIKRPHDILKDIITVLKIKISGDLNKNKNGSMIERRSNASKIKHVKKDMIPRNINEFLYIFFKKSHPLYYFILL